MAENKPSAESGLSSVSSNPSLSSPGSRTSNEEIVVRKQPPSHVFTDEWFEVEVILQHSKARGMGSEKGSDRVVELVPTLREPKGRLVPAEEASLLTNPQTLRVPLSESPPLRKRKIRCKIGTAVEPGKDTSVAYVIYLAPNASSDDVVSNIGAVTTRNIGMVRYKIALSPNKEWQSVWYKDEGGRDKAMAVTVGLVDKADKPVQGEAVPLQVTLFYESADHPVRVNNQEILRLIGEENYALDKSTGKATIRFRVEDVSKNHQGQNFVVEVAPSAKHKEFKHIGPGFTPAVSIRSKRNKRQRSAAGLGEARPRMHSPARMQHPSSMLRGEQMRRMEKSPFAGEDITQLRDAMKGVIQWTEEVVNGIYPLQWHVIGYSQHPDGSPDYTRPYHNMPNPNGCISRLLSMYTTQTRDNLRIVLNALNAVESATPSHERDDSYQSSTSSTGGGGGALREPQEYFNMLHGGMLPGMPPGGMPPAGMQPARIQPAGIPVQSASPLGPYGRRMPLGSAPDMPPGPTPDMFRPGGSPMSLAVARPPAPNRGPSGRPVGRTHATLLQDAGRGAAVALTRGRDLPSPDHEERPEQGGKYDVETRESEVAYVLARQFKSVRTGGRLGFPAYGATKDMLGFYSESTHAVGVGQFMPISRYADEFGPSQMLHCKQILEDAMEKNSPEVYALKDWGSISNLIDHAIVYAWSKDIDPTLGGSRTSSTGSMAD